MTNSTSPYKGIYIYQVYATVNSVTSSIELNVCDENDFTQAEWDALDEADQEECLQVLYENHIGNICDSGWAFVEGGR